MRSFVYAPEEVGFRHVQPRQPLVLDGSEHPEFYWKLLVLRERFVGESEHRKRGEGVEAHANPT